MSAAERPAIDLDGDILDSRLLYETCLVRLLRQRAASTPDGPYFTCEGDTLTFSALWERAGRLAGALARGGVRQGELVTALSHNSTSYLTLFHACLRVGAVFAPLNIALRHDDLAQTLTRLAPRHFIITEELAGEHAAVVKGLPPAIQVSSLESHLRASACVDPADAPAHHWSAGEWSWIMFSGATTGLPKAIKLPHAYALASGQRLVEALGLSSRDRFYWMGSSCHGWLNFPVLVGCLLVRAYCGNVRWFSASRWLGAVKGFGATVVDVFLPMAGALMARPKEPGERDHAHPRLHRLDGHGGRAAAPAGLPGALRHHAGQHLWSDGRRGTRDNREPQRCPPARLGRQTDTPFRGAWSPMSRDGRWRPAGRAKS